MRVKGNEFHNRQGSPLPPRRRSGPGWHRARHAPPRQGQSGDQAKIEPIQWLTIIAICLTSLALMALIWTLSERAIDDEAADIRADAEQRVRSVAFSLASAIQGELRLVDQSLAIIQDDWNTDSDRVDLGAWRKRLLALTEVSDDIFIANEQRIIVRGTLPRSIGQGFGSAYVTYPNGDLETFEADGTKNPDGMTPGTVKLEARQFLMYVLRPLAEPRGWWVGASYRSEAITKLFAGANLGEDAVVGLADLPRGALQAIVGRSAQSGEMDIARSELMEQSRKNEAGIWAGASPMDRLSRIIAYQRLPGRNMSVIVGVATDTAMRPLYGLAGMARELAVVGSVVVATVGGILIWAIMTARGARQRERNRERAERDLTHVREELALERARVLLSEPEAGVLLASPGSGVARLDGQQRLLAWNQRFADLSGVALDATAAGTPIEDVFRCQASAGLFGDAATAEAAVATRLTILHTAGGSVAPPRQSGPDGERVAMHVRGVFDGGLVILLVGPDRTRFSAARAAAEEETGSETAGEATEW